APDPEAAPPSAAMAAAANPGIADDIVAEFAQAVSTETVPDAAAAPTIEVPDTGNPMKDFEAAVQMEKKMAEKAAGPTAPAPAAPAPVAAPAPEPVPAPPAPAPKPAAGPKGEADDIFAEFEEPPPIDEGALDTDKMMAEMAALVSHEPSSGSA